MTKLYINITLGRHVSFLPSPFLLSFLSSCPSVIPSSPCFYIYFLSSSYFILFVFSLMLLFLPTFLPFLAYSSSLLSFPLLMPFFPPSITPYYASFLQIFFSTFLVLTPLLPCFPETCCPFFLPNLVSFLSSLFLFLPSSPSSLPLVVAHPQPS